MMMDVRRFQLVPINSILLLVDTQAGLMAAMRQDVRENVEKNINLLVSSIELMNVPVLITEQYPKGLGLTIESIRQNLGDLYKPIEKMSFSCWDVPSFRKEIKRFNAKNVFIAGIEAHVCVLQTTIDLLSNGYNVHVVSDAVCSRFKLDWEMALSLLEQAGAVITTTEILVFQLLKRAGTAKFKSISPLFKNR
jgi:nicotinamidase-related amidase